MEIALKPAAPLLFGFVTTAYTHFFQMAAWIVMRSHINGRVAMRMLYYMGMGRSEFDIAYMPYDSDEFLYWLGSLPEEFREYVEPFNVIQLLHTVC